MIRRYFIHNGRRCKYGEIVRLRYENRIVDATFLGHITERHYYAFIIYGCKTKDGKLIISVNEEDFAKRLIEYTGRFDQVQLKESPPDRMLGKKPLTASDEIEIEGMLFAWAVYIVLMAVTLIFNGFYLYWAVISAGFFLYRTGKLKEAGYSISIENHGCASIFIGAALVIGIIIMLQ